MADAPSAASLLPLVAALLAAGLAVAWVVRPLFTPRPPAPPPADDRLDRLLAHKEAVLSAIRELDFDYKLGKLSEEDFARYDARLRRQAIALIKQIEEIDPASARQDDALEAEIARRRSERSTAHGQPETPTID